MNTDIVSLSVPAKPDYILAVRLVVSAVAERAGFNIEDIEDLKVASAEACTMLLTSEPELIQLSITVGDGISIEFCADGANAEQETDNELSQYLLGALVDDCDFLYEGSVLNKIRFKKSCYKTG